MGGGGEERESQEACRVSQEGAVMQSRDPKLAALFNLIQTHVGSSEHPFAPSAADEIRSTGS